MTEATRNDLIERTGRAWAVMDGKADRFDACKADHALDLKEGRYMGYIADAESLLEKAGIISDLHPLPPKGDIQ